MGAEVPLSPEKRSKYFLAVLVLLLVVAPLFMGGINLIVDYMWFKQEGFNVLFTNILKGRIELGGLTGIGFILIVGLNLILAQALGHQDGHGIHRDVIELSATERVNYGMRWLIWIAVLFVGYGLSHWGMANWKEYLLAKHGLPMGLSDPLFGLELGAQVLKPIVSSSSSSFPFGGFCTIWR